MSGVSELISNYLPLKIQITDIVEIILLSVLFYHVLLWMKNTRAWMLFKGILVILIATFIASVFNLSTIMWLLNKTLSVGIIAVVVVFQPELRKALEQLGKKNLFGELFSFDDEKKKMEGKFSDRTINELVKATFELARTKTGALIVIEGEINLEEYIRTGINIDSAISSQLLINIFEHNTPLHDGAVIIRGDRIVSATCYLPLSNNMELSKELGTRHRAGVGVSENSDAFTIIVSEQTGKVSVTRDGQITRNLDGDNLRRMLVKVQDKNVEAKRFKLLRGRRENERKTDK